MGVVAVVLDPLVVACLEEEWVAEAAEHQESVPADTKQILHPEEVDKIARNEAR